MQIGCQQPKETIEKIRQKLLAAHRRGCYAKDRRAFMGYKIIEDGGKKWIWGQHIVPYAREKFQTNFNIPSYSMIRHLASSGQLPRPQHLSKEAYYDFEVIMKWLEERQRR